MWHKSLPYKSFTLLPLFGPEWGVRPGRHRQLNTFSVALGGADISQCGIVTVPTARLVSRQTAPRRPASCSAKPNHFHPSALSAPARMPANFCSIVDMIITSGMKNWLECLNVSLTFWSKWFEFSQQKLLPKLRELMISGFQPNNGPNCELSCSFANNFYFLSGRRGE